MGKQLNSFKKLRRKCDITHFNDFHKFLNCVTRRRLVLFTELPDSVANLWTPHQISFFVQRLPTHTRTSRTTVPQAELVAAGSLLGVGAAALMRGLGTRSAARAGRGQARAASSAAVAAAARDALAKALYCRTVATIVRRANSLKRLGSTLGTLSSDSNESVSVA